MRDLEVVHPLGEGPSVKVSIQHVRQWLFRIAAAATNVRGDVASGVSQGKTRVHLSFIGNLKPCSLASQLKPSKRAYLGWTRSTCATWWLINQVLERNKPPKKDEKQLLGLYSSQVPGILSSQYHSWSHWAKLQGIPPLRAKKVSHGKM